MQSRFDASSLKVVIYTQIVGWNRRVLIGEAFFREADVKGMIILSAVHVPFDYESLTARSSYRVWNEENKKTAAKEHLSDSFGFQDFSHGRSSAFIQPG